MNPKRIQLKRTRGWRMPNNTIKVDRSTRWGNPFKVGDEGVPDAATAVRLFEKMIDHWASEPIERDNELFVFTRERIAQDLRGKNLACWCAGPPCHADVLLKIANAPCPVVL